MVQDSNLWDYSAAADAFEAHIQSDSYVGFRFGKFRDSEPPGLLDCIQHWLEHGNAVEMASSFQIYLRTVVEITRRWSFHNDRMLGSDHPLWPNQLGSKIGPALSFINNEWDGLPAWWVEEGGTFPERHPAVDDVVYHTVWEARLGPR